MNLISILIENDQIIIELHWSIISLKIFASGHLLVPSRAGSIIVWLLTDLDLGYFNIKMQKVDINDIFAKAFEMITRFGQYGIKNKKHQQCRNLHICVFTFDWLR